MALETQATYCTSTKQTDSKNKIIFQVKATTFEVSSHRYCFHGTHVQKYRSQIHCGIHFKLLILQQLCVSNTLK